jgi:hypothetical protein
VDVVEPADADGALTQSYSVKADPTLDALGVSARRADVSGSVAYPFGQVAVGYVSVGRSLTSSTRVAPRSAWPAAWPCASTAASPTGRKSNGAARHLPSGGLNSGAKRAPLVWT